ncbi:Exosome complex component RRP42 [Gaertneriomyces sp. JEL0708]|nr:Exosome complex component RRP42 [Gaertneriomyces sp. JEL0708]
MISITERDYISKGVEANIRADGRGKGDYRALHLETGLVAQASGSCRVKLDSGTDVLVCVKVEIGSIEPSADNDADDDTVLDEGEWKAKDRDRGRISCNVECSPSATRGLMEPQDVENMCIEYSQFMNRVLNGDQGGIDLKSLCIIHGSTCWILNIDVLVLDFGGNLLDIILVATRGALHNTRIPKAIIEESDGKVDFAISDDETELVRGWEGVPLCVTLNKIGYGHVVDASPSEEMCASCRLSVMINNKGNICATQKSGTGGLEPSLLAEMQQTARNVAQTLFRRLDTALLEEERRISRGIEPKGFRKD